MIGRILSGRYQVMERLGGGGMAVVYKALDTFLNRQVSVKVLRSQYADDEEFVRRFRREALAVASLGHPNIVNIYDVGQDGEIYYTIMEYIEGETLRELIEREGVLAPERAVEITKEILEGLHHAHRHHIIHRDIKPHNILITKEGRVKVTDFGIALAANSGATIVHTGRIIGSAHYLSPEQARGAPSDERSDIYAVGVVLFEMISGQRPYDGDTALIVAMQHLEKPVPDLRALNPAIPSALAGIVRRAMSKQPDRRYATAQEMIQDLNAWQQGLPVNRPSRDGDAELDATRIIAARSREEDETRSELEDAEELPERSSRSARLWIGVTLLSLLAIALISYLAVRSWLYVPTTEVPNVIGLTLEEAEDELNDAGLDFEVAEEIFSEEQTGTVMSQDPAAGEVVRSSRIVYLTVSKGQEPVEIPLVSGMHRLEARNRLVNLGLDVQETERHHESVPADYVIESVPGHGAERVKGSSVELIVSLGPEKEPFSMPNLIGKSFEEARDLLLSLGLDLDEIKRGGTSDQPQNTVMDQEPDPGTQVETGDPVDLVLSDGCRNQAQETIRVSQDGVRLQIELFDERGSRVIYDQERNRGEFPLTICWQGEAARYFVKEDGTTTYSQILKREEN